MEGLNVLVSIVVLTMPFIFVIAIQWIKTKEKCKQYDVQAELYAKALEKGQAVPTEMFAKPVKPEKINKPLNIGIICMAAGIGITLMLWFMSIAFVRLSEEEASIALKGVASVGIIPFLVGVAFLIIHFIEKKKSANENA
jgi:small-conductance mechanosensitive channel